MIIFQHFFNQPEFCPWDSRLVTRNNMVLMINPMEIQVRLVLIWKLQETISRFRATLSAIGIICHEMSMICICSEMPMICSIKAQQHSLTLLLTVHTTTNVYVFARNRVYYTYDIHVYTRIGVYMYVFLCIYNTTHIKLKKHGALDSAHEMNLGT